MSEQQIGELSQRLIEHWDEWDVEAEKAAQAAQSSSAWEYEMNAQVSEYIRDFLNR